MRVLNLGSLNIDHVYQVPRIVSEGVTLPATSYRVFAGGKGANQSVALGRAGAQVTHAGAVGADGAWLLERLHSAGVDVSLVRTVSEPTGHAVIQVDARGSNAIVIYGGANRTIEPAHIDAAIAHVNAGDWLLLQNVVSHVPHALRAAKRAGLQVCFNAAPFEPGVLDYPLDAVDLLIVNETEAAGIARLKPGTPVPRLLDVLSQQLPNAQVVLTRGGDGVTYRDADGVLSLPAAPAKVVDTTAAGDCFVGYFLAHLAKGEAVETCLHRATHAAAVCVSRPGAMDSIPRRDEVRLD